MPEKVTDAQLELLRVIAAGNAGADTPNGQRGSARALQRRKLVSIRGRGASWRAEVTDAGSHYLEHGTYPPEMLPAPVQRQQTASRKAEPEPKWDVDSPRGIRESGRHPRGDEFLGGPDDPFDGKILISVKEAAWMLSLPESAVYKAVRDWDIDRVYIGAGTTNYRIIYGSLLAWVNDLPRESTRQGWWE